MEFNLLAANCHISALGGENFCDLAGSGVHNLLTPSDILPEASAERKTPLERNIIWQAGRFEMVMVSQVRAWTNASPCHVQINILKRLRNAFPNRIRRSLIRVVQFKFLLTCKVQYLLRTPLALNNFRCSANIVLEYDVQRNKRTSLIPGPGGDWK